MPHHGTSKNHPVFRTPFQYNLIQDDSLSRQALPPTPPPSETVTIITIIIIKVSFGFCKAFQKIKCDVYLKLSPETKESFPTAGRTYNNIGCTSV